MRVLLDTHALLWALNEDPRLSQRAAEVIGDASIHKLISAVFGSEVCLKHTLGKLPEAAVLAQDFEGQIATWDVEVLPIPSSTPSPREGWTCDTAIRSIAC